MACGGGSGNTLPAGQCNGIQISCRCGDGRVGSQCKPVGPDAGLGACLCPALPDSGLAPDLPFSLAETGGRLDLGGADLRTDLPPTGGDAPVDVPLVPTDGAADGAPDRPSDAPLVLDATGDTPPFGLDGGVGQDGAGPSVDGRDDGLADGGPDAAGDDAGDAASDPPAADLQDAVADLADATSDVGDAVSDQPVVPADGAPDTPDTLAPPPVIVSLCAESVRGGISLVIRGSGFSAAPANNVVSFAGTTVTPTAAQPDALVVQTPATVPAGSLTVTVDGRTSNALAYLLGPRKGNVDGSGAALPGTPQGLGSNADGRLLALTVQDGGRNEVVLLDRVAGTVTHMPTVDSAAPSADMGNPQLSADGRWLVFDSAAANLVAGDTNVAADVFLFEVATGKLARISNGLGGQEANGPSSFPFPSANGRHIVFQSTATNLVFDDGNASTDVFLFDRELGTMRAISVNGTGAAGSGLGTTANGPSTRPVVSGDGMIVAYQSEATNLVASDTNTTSDIFVLDRKTGKNTRVSLGPGGIQANGASSSPSLSGDGHLVVFTSLATDFIAGNGDSNGFADVFAYDRQAATITRVSVTATGGQANSGASASTRNSVSADGRYVVFASDARDMATGASAGDSNLATDVFVRDLVGGTTRRVSVDGAGAEVDGASPTSLAAAEGQMALSLDGRLVLFVTAASNLLAGDGSAAPDVVATPNSLPSCPAPFLFGASQDALRSKTVVDLCGVGLDPDPSRDAVSFATVAGVASSADRYRVTAEAPTNLAAGTLGVQVAGAGASNSFAYTLMPIRANLGSSGAWANGDALEAVASADGQRVVFVSAATNLAGGHTASATDVFLFDRWTGAQARVNHSTGGAVPGTGLSSSGGRISADGRFVAFDSLASTLVAGDTNSQSDVFVYDAQTGATTRVSVSSAEVQGTGGGSFGPAVSRDGRFVAFYSDAVDLVAGDANAAQDVFLRDRWLGETTLVSVASLGAQGNGSSREPSVSADGLFVAFRSAASSLVDADTNLVDDVFLRDRVAGTTVRASVSSAGAQANGDSRGAVLSADGRYLAFESDATNLVTGDDNGVTDVFLRDNVANTTVRISRASDGGNANGASHRPSLSADGRYVAFHSDASNLVAGDTGGYTDVFVFDRQTGTTVRVSTTSDSHTGGTDVSSTPSLSPDGRYVVFLSRAQNMVGSADTGAFFDVFVTPRSP